MKLKPSKREAQTNATDVLSNYFVAGCIASSFPGWIASLHPMTFRAVLCLLAAIAIGWGLSWLLDFSLSKLLNISVVDLQGFTNRWG
jgi:hypothetical protein